MEKFTGVFTSERIIGTVGNKTVEIGHYTMDGKEFDNKVYIFDHFKKRNGTDDSRVVAKFTIEEFEALKKMDITKKKTKSRRK